MDIKYIEDRSGNKVLPITSVNAVKDASNTSLDTILSNYKSEVNGRLDDQDDIIETLNGNDVIPVDTLPSPASAEANKIYRLAGTDSYTDYMLDTQAVPLAMKPIATYSFPGIDDEPTAGSDNLVKSEGVAKEIYNDILAAANYKFDTTKTSAAALGDVVYFGSNVPITNGKDYIVFIKSSVEAAVSGGNIALLDGDTKISEQYSFSTSDLRNGVYFKITATATATTNGRARIWQYNGFPAGIYTFMIAEYGGQYDKIYNSIDSIHDDIRDINIQSSPEFITTYSAQHANECVIGSNLKIHSGKKYLVYIKSSVSYTPQNVRLVTNNGSTVIGRSSEPLGLNFQNGQYVEIVATGSSDNADVRCWGAAPAGEYRMRIAEIGENFIQRFDEIDSKVSGISNNLVKGINKANLNLYGLVQSGNNVITSDLISLPQLGITVDVVAPTGKSVVIYAYKNGSVVKQATCIDGGTFDFESNSFYKLSILDSTVSEVSNLIEAGDLSLTYFGDTSSVTDRNVHREPVVKAIGYERIHVNNVDSYENKHLSKLPMFIHVTDVHGDAKRLMNAYQYGEHIAADYVVNTGDTVVNSYADGQKFAQEIDADFNIPTLNTPGNHDANGSNNNQNLYASCVQYYKDRWGYTTNGEPYYYKDDSNLKIRFISLNDYDGGYYSGGGRISQEQFDWFVSALASTPADYGVILIQHMCCVTSDRVTAIEQDFNSLYYNDWCSYYGNIIMSIIDAFIAKQSTTLEFTREYPDRATESYSVSADFTNLNSGVEFICHVCGHSHADCIGYLPSTQRQLNITSTLTNSLYGAKMDITINGTYGEIDELPRETSGVTQDSFNVFAIDRNKKEVRIAKVGSNFSQTLKTRDYVIASYA